MPNTILNVLDPLKQAVDGLTLGLLLRAAIVLAVGVFVMRLVLWLADRGMHAFGVEQGFRDFLRTLLRLLLWGGVLIGVMGALGINPTSFMALLGVFALAFSLAVQGSLANIAGGFMLVATKPFLTGDFIEADTILGEVRQIGLIHTELHTADGKAVYMPNSQLTTSVIINYSRRPQRRVEISFRAAAQEDPRLVRQVILEAASTVPEVLQEPAPYVGIGSFSEKGTEFVLRVWVENRNYRTVTFDLQEAVRAAFIAHQLALGVQMLL